jgi:hypothetical protein
VSGLQDDVEDLLPNVEHVEGLLLDAELRRLRPVTLKTTGSWSLSRLLEHVATSSKP